MHNYHENLPGYDAGNLWHDGCEECEYRARNLPESLSSLAHNSFRQAWADMLAAKWSGGAGLTRRVSACDWHLLNALYVIAVSLERNAGQDPRLTLVTIDARCEELEAQLVSLFGPREAE